MFRQGTRRQGMARQGFAITTCALAVMGAFAVQAEEQLADVERELETITIFGSQAAADNTPGAAAFIGPEELEKFDYTDVMRVLTQVPGVYVSEEEGFGLRPNIGMRGAPPSRSEKITVMEDGVLVAPAPYSAPAAYYFPTIGRMQAVEVFKGTSAVKYGPQTTSGVINMVSRQVPDQAEASVDLSFGEDNFFKGHGYAGGGDENLSGLVEWFHYQSDGFRDINGVGDDTGFEKDDFMAKLKTERLFGMEGHELELKGHYAEEDSDETYLGLTDEDYHDDPYQRYSASQKDNMDTERWGVQLNHYLRITSELEWSSNLYYNDFKRNWYKTSGGLVEEASAWDKDPAGLLPQEVSVKANNRDYEAWGIQTEGRYEWGDHVISLGGRYHEDEVERFQWQDTYDLMPDQRMVLTNAGIPGTDSNRLETAEAWSFFVDTEWQFDDLRVDAGARYEQVDLKRKDWGKTDPGRDNAPSVRKNDVDGFMPAVGLTYTINEQLVVLAGVQKGFAPPSPGNNEAREEESWNYEAGLRYGNDVLSAEAIGFFSDYDNMHGNCTAAQGCDEESIGNQENAGEVEIYGLEASVDYRIDALDLSWPLGLRYTYTSTEFQQSFDSDIWGVVEEGDELPYVPEHLLQLSAGVEGANWRADMLGRYQNDVRTEAGQGSIAREEKIPDRWVVDFSAHYQLAEQHRIYLKVDNLLDEEYISTRVHGGIQTGMPRTAYIGYKFSH